MVFLVWSGRKLSAKRLARQDVLPFAVIGAVLLAIYSVAATVYVPRLFNTYATRYGVIGAVFAMISALFCVMVVLVVATAAGREVRDELGRIRRGEKPADDEVHRQWQEITAQARSRWETLRVQLEERRQAPEGGRGTRERRDSLAALGSARDGGDADGATPATLHLLATMATSPSHGRAAGVGCGPLGALAGHGVRRGR